MCIDFDGHHFGGSSFDSVIRCGPYPQVPDRFKKKKKNQVKSPSPESRVPETGSDPPIGSGRDSGRDRQPGPRQKQTRSSASRSHCGLSVALAQRK